MIGFWVIFSLAVPLFGVVLSLTPQVPKSVCRGCLSLFALPALAAAILVPSGTVLEVEDLLLGSTLGLTDLSRPFLLFTAWLWMLAGWFSAALMKEDPRLRSYTAYFLLSFTGNIAIYFARDIPLFYTGFAVMTFAAYGLVLHTRTQEATRAGTLYIAMAVAGEVMVLSGLIGLAYVTGSVELEQIRAGMGGASHLFWISLLILAGFGVKAGMIPLHGWLPLAHPVAPAAASAVLSGAMIKAGLFGWLTFLPGGEVSLPALGQGCMILGLFAALAGAMAAWTQSRPKANLAYSSISQMGLMTLTLGIGLANPSSWPYVVTTLSFYAMAHALAKGALFMAAGAAPNISHSLRKPFLAGVVLTCLVIAGAPWTAGEAAKKLVKSLAADLPGSWGNSLGFWLMLSTLATTLLLVRLVQLFLRSMPTDGKVASPQSRITTGVLGLAVLSALVAPRLMVEMVDLKVKFPDLTFKSVTAAWPIALGILLGPFLLKRVGDRFRVPTGDLGLLLLAGGHRLSGIWRQTVAARLEQLKPTTDRLLAVLVRRNEDTEGWAETLERKIRSMEGAGVVLFAFLGVLWWSLQI